MNAPAVRVGSLRPGDYFITAGTKRMGVVLATQYQNGLMGIACDLEKPDEAKYLHPDVMVVPEE